MISYVGQMFTNAEIVGIDADPAKLEFAKEHTCCRIDFRQHDINEPLPFKKNHFDLVISHGFLAVHRPPTYG